MFPSDTAEFDVGAGGVVHDADITKVPNDPARYSAAALILCVNYRGGGKTLYQTQAWLGLYDDNRILIPIGVDADADSLKLIREPNGDHAN